MTRRIAIVDTETASLRGPVIELAIIWINENLDVLSTFETLIDPIVPIVPAAQAVHHITQGMVADAPTMTEFIERDGNPFAGDGELVFVAHNAQFDARMLADVLPQEHKRICTLKMARAIWPDLNMEECNHKLETLVIMFGLETGAAHRAMGDCVAGLSLLRHMATVTGASSFDELISLGVREISQDSKLNFGQKHRDTKIKDVPVSYLNWMLANVTDLDPDLRVAITSRLKP